MKGVQGLYEICYGGVVQSRLDVAQRLWREYGPKLSADEELQGVLQMLLEKERAIGRQMATMELHRLCSHCASRPGGGCCSLFMAGENDAIQLLMNLLAGRTVTMVRNDGVQCVFLGEGGCSLLLKPMFCLNYNCTQIKASGHGLAIRRLEELTGELLQCQYALEQKLLSFFHQQQLAKLTQ